MSQEVIKRAEVEARKFLTKYPKYASADAGESAASRFTKCLSVVEPADSHASSKMKKLMIYLQSRVQRQIFSIKKR